MVIKMRKKKIKEVLENVLPEEVEEAHVEVKKVVSPKKAILDDEVSETEMLQTKDVEKHEND